MKRITLIVLLLVTFSLQSQISVKYIEYEIELIDPLTGGKPYSPGANIDWKFEVFFNDSILSMQRQFSSKSSEKRVINRNQNEVLYMLHSNKDNSFFFTTIPEMLNMDMSSNYGDTVIKTTREKKNILGFDCNRIEMNFGDQATAIFWVTESLSAGTIIPGTPLSSKYIALEYEFEDPNLKVIYKAKRIEDVVISKEYYSILEEYKLIVPVSEFDVSGLFPKESSEFSFIHYPMYQKGLKQFHEDIRALCKLEPKVKDPIGNFHDAYISFTVNKDGTLGDIKISGIDDQEIVKVREMLGSLKFIPADVKGGKVASDVTITVNLNKK